MTIGFSLARSTKYQELMPDSFDHERLAMDMRKVAQPKHHLLVGKLIQPAGQFIEEEKRRVADQFLCQGHPSHLSTGKGAVGLIQLGPKPGKINDMIQPFVALAGRNRAALSRISRTVSSAWNAPN